MLWCLHDSVRSILALSSARFYIKVLNRTYRGGHNNTCLTTRKLPSDWPCRAMLIRVWKVMKPAYHGNTAVPLLHSHCHTRLLLCSNKLPAERPNRIWNLPKGLLRQAVARAQPRRAPSLFTFNYRTCNVMCSGSAAGRCARVSLPPPLTLPMSALET